MKEYIFFFLEITHLDLPRKKLLSFTYVFLIHFENVPFLLDFAMPVAESSSL